MKKERSAKQVKQSLETNTRELARIKALQDTLKERMDELKETVQADMGELSMDTYYTKEYTYSLVAGGVQERVNKSDLQKYHPNVYAQVVKKVETKGSLRMSKAKKGLNN